jgi:uncharacterized FlaG/YvyC family protein
MPRPGPNIGEMTSCDEAIPAHVPFEVRRDVRVAAHRVEDLAERERELHFAHDRRSGRLVVQIRDFDGFVLRAIQPSEALDIMAGLAETYA